MNKDSRTQLQPHRGWRWFGFTTRIPFIHTKVCWPEMFQGLMVSAATALALVPLLTTYFGLTFAEAVAMTVIHSTLISSSWLVFGEPYSPGWLTPALPFTLAVVLSSAYDTPELRLQMMMAISLDFAFVLVVLGITGLGAKLIRWMPEVLKGAVIMAAAIAALLKVFDYSEADNVFAKQPITASVALGLSILLAFSAPIHRFATRFKPLAFILSLGLLPGFILGGLAGGLFGELEFNVEWGIMSLPFADMFKKVMPFYIGWPSWSMYLDALPLAFIAYLLFFGDLVTGKEILGVTSKNRPDESLDINDSRTHITVAIRNFLCAIIAPFFPTQGVLWTGIHVLITQRWQQGQQVMRSLYDGVSSYYLFGLPIFFFIAPLITGIKPLMPIALAVTLVLTGFACAYIAMDKVKTNAERGAMFMGAIFLVVFEPWLGLLLAAVTALALVEFKPQQDTEA